MAAPGSESLDAFCERLADDPSAAGAWRDEPDPTLFAVRLAEAGCAAGYAFDPEEVTALLARRRREWRERFLD